VLLKLQEYANTNEKYENGPGEFPSSSQFDATSIRLYVYCKKNSRWWFEGNQRVCHLLSQDMWDRGKVEIKAKNGLNNLNFDGIKPRDLERIYVVIKPLEKPKM
jgi:hypothetical protein